MRPAKVGEPGTFAFWKDGKQGAIKAPGEVLDVIDNLSPQQVNLVWKISRASAQMLRTLATLARNRAFRQGRQRVAWNRMRGKALVSGAALVTAEAHSRFGTTGLQRAVTLAPPKRRP